jgi:hypothetical protein
VSPVFRESGGRELTEGNTFIVYRNSPLPQHLESLGSQQRFSP